MRGDPEPKQVRVAGIYFFTEVAVPAPLVRPAVLSGAGLPPTPGKPRRPGKFACAPGAPGAGGCSLPPFSQQERRLQRTPKSACRSAGRAERAWGRLLLRCSKADIWLGRSRLAPLPGPFQGLVLGQGISLSFP